jgi:hypothetical protein
MGGHPLRARADAVSRSADGREGAQLRRFYSFGVCLFSDGRIREFLVIEGKLTV